jgi:hypothetical protein
VGKQVEDDQFGDHGFQAIPDAVYEYLKSNILKLLPITLSETASKWAAERLAHMLNSAVSMCAYRWSVSNRSVPPTAHRPRNVDMRQWFGSLAPFWHDHVGWPGVSFDGEHHGGPFARFALAMCKKLLVDLKAERLTRDAPFVRALELVCSNPQKVRMWLRQVGITQLGSNFERFLRGKVFLARELPEWQFEVDEPRENCYQVSAIDPDGRSRFKRPEYGLNLAAVKKAAVARAKRLSKTTRKARPK